MEESNKELTKELAQKEKDIAEVRSYWGPEGPTTNMTSSSQTVIAFGT